MKVIILIVIVGVVAYNSVYFRKLDEHNASKTAKAFDAASYAKVFWETKLPQRLDSAVEVDLLRLKLAGNPDEAFAQYSHALGIGNLRYFLVKGAGTIEGIGADDVTVVLATGTRIRIATEFIFGNAVRDASGQINVNEFVNTMDFNNVSAEINKIIRERVLPPFKSTMKKGSVVNFTGAIELNKEHLDLSDIELIPIQIKVDAGS